jgi:ATP-dependent Clp protease adapter protein ClpS
VSRFQLRIGNRAEPAAEESRLQDRGPKTVILALHDRIVGGSLPGSGTNYDGLWSAEGLIWRVLLLNDDHTPIDFVVDVIEEVFDMDRESAMHLMLRVHNEGVAECGIYPYEIAKVKAAQVMDFAREHTRHSHGVLVLASHYTAKRSSSIHLTHSQKLLTASGPLVKDSRLLSASASSRHGASLAIGQG